MAKAIKTGGHPIDWTYLILMVLVGLGLLIIFGIFVLSPIAYLLGY